MKIIFLKLNPLTIRQRKDMQIGIIFLFDNGLYIHLHLQKSKLKHIN